MVKILIGNVTSRVIGYLPESVHEELDKKLSYTPANTEHMKSVKEGRWDGVFHLYKKNYGQSFDTGLLSMVLEVLGNNDIKIQKADDRIKPEVNLPHLTFNPTPDYEERDYQQFSIDRAYNRTRGLLKVATGGGKTLMISELIARIQTAPFMFYVLTKDLMEQAYEALSETLNEPIGRIGGGQWDIQKINVCTIQTAVMAVNLKNKKFKISDYRFDDEDIWDKGQLESEDRLEYLKKLLRATKGIYFDECITGDSILMTEQGETRIDEIKKNNCRYVLTYDGINIVYKPIVKWMPKGVQKTIKIEFENGEIKCTTDHPIYTNKGWIQAERIKIGDKVLFVDADAEHGLNQTNMEEKENSFLGIRSKSEVETTGERDSVNMLKSLLDVNADAAIKSNLAIAHSMRSSIQEELLDIRNTSKDTTSSQYITNIISPSLKKKLEPLWEPVWETLPSSFQTKDLETIDCLQLMDSVKKNGLNTKLILSNALGHLLKRFQTVDMEKCQQECGRDVCHALQRLQTFCTMVEKNEYQKNGSILSEILDLLGGSATMEAILIIECLLLYILRDLAKRKTKLSRDGLMTKAFAAKSVKVKNAIICYLALKVLLKSKVEYNDMCRPACNTNWKTVQSITEYKKENVYDIEVEDTHCFFANGILVHNCHHSSAKTCQDVLTASPQAFWKFGGSATPYREDGAEIMLQALFGRKIVDISASYLIDKGFLIEPYIFFEPIQDNCKLHSFRSIYSECITKNDYFNAHVADTANFLIEQNMSTLVLVQHIHHGEDLQKRIPGSVLVTGKVSNKKRKQAIQDLRDRKCMCMIATCLADEGLDIPTLDAVLLAGGGASATRVHQRIGRTLRKDRQAKNPRDRSIVIYYKHDAKYLKNHAAKAMSIMKEEPRFNIVKSKGAGQILGEISKIMGFDYHPKTIFDL